MQEQAFSSRLRALRTARGQSQTALSEAIGFAQTTISQWEAGEYEPALLALTKLSAHFGCTTDYLCGVADHPQSLRPGDWIVDLDTYDAAVAGDQRVAGELLAVPIPDRFQIVTSKEYAALRAKAHDGLGHPHTKKRGEHR